MEFTLTGLELPVRICPERPMTDEELLRFCAVNDALQIEREPNGELTVMSPTGLDTGDVDSEINFQLRSWASSANTGKAFGSSTGFRLPNGAVRSPDAALISWDRFNVLTPEQRRGFAPICPEFIIELRSPSDRLPDLQHKMGEWTRNGAQLAWLIDPERKIVEVYRPGATAPDVLEGPTSVYGEGPVGGFVLELARIWQ
jgi:Uma2 family endonuclease